MDLSETMRTNQSSSDSCDFCGNINIVYRVGWSRESKRACVECYGSLNTRLLLTQSLGIRSHPRPATSQYIRNDSSHKSRRKLTNPVLIIPVFAVIGVASWVITSPRFLDDRLSQSPSASVSGTPSASATTTYTVQSGDTLFAICSNLSSLDPLECVDRVLEINSITDPSSIAVGETLTIPQ